MKVISKLYAYSLLLIVISFTASCSKKTLTKSSSQFSPLEKKLVTGGTSTVPFRVLKIDNKADSITLRQVCQMIQFDRDKDLVNLFIDRLYATVRDSISLGVGIAAPQVGLLKRIIWVQRFDKEDQPFEVYINPVIKQYSIKSQTCPEGCLSIPDRQEILNSRSYAILLEYDDRIGTHHTEMVEDFTAVIFQHEIDHLDGIMYIDHLEKEVNKKP